MNRKAGFTLIMIIFILSAAGCATPIHRIKSEPEVFVGREVRVSGEVTLEIPIPFMDFSIYQIDDGTGRIFLISGGTHHIGDRLQSSAEVIGITKKGSKTAAAEITEKTADFLVKHKMADPGAAEKLSKKLFRLIAALGEQVEGSYFLMSK
ncbi:MAG: hypothetical protein JEZ04_19775 [Spirochaetales bacterium]|nr:hypothetical protein [Spirochaetales bacterium]